MIRGVLFDFDGTLTRPEALDFALLRRATGCPPDQNILEYIGRLPDPAARAQALATLHGLELEAAARSHPNEDAEQVIADLRSRGFVLGLITRNSREAVLTALGNFARTRVSDFTVIVSRESDAPPKPDPGGVLLACRAMDVAPAALMVVGDYLFDIEAGARAQAVTTYLTNGRAVPVFRYAPTHIVARLGELLPLLPATAR